MVPSSKLVPITTCVWDLLQEKTDRHLSVVGYKTTLGTSGHHNSAFRHQIAILGTLLAPAFELVLRTTHSWGLHEEKHMGWS